MKKTTLSILLVLLLVAFSACNSTTETPNDNISQTKTSVSNEVDEITTVIGAQSKFTTDEINEKEETMQISVKSSDYEIIYELNDSQAAKELYSQLPLTLEVEPFSNNEMTFYPPEKLSVNNTPLSDGTIGSLSYYAPWGDVVMFYAPCSPNGSLYGLGAAISGVDNISKLSGKITVSVYAN